MDTQDIFDKVVTHLLKQGVAAKAQDVNGDMNCSYRGDNGTMCAVGCLISDENYSPDLEGSPALRSNVKEAVERSIGRKLDRTETHLLGHLQSIHDDARPWDWPRLLEQLAYQSNLQYRGAA